MPYLRLNASRFIGYVAQIVFSEPFDKQEFEATKIKDLLFSIYEVGCEYEELVLVLDMFVEAGRLTCLIPNQRYKIKPVAAKV